jgi:hypothetical protein
MTFFVAQIGHFRAYSKNKIIPSESTLILRNFVLRATGSLPYYDAVPIMAPPSYLLGFCFKFGIWGIDRKALPPALCLPQKKHGYVMRAKSYVIIRQM